MLNEIFNSFRLFFSKYLSGFGKCYKCPCLEYEDANTGNDYCKCGHSYEDHW